MRRGTEDHNLEGINRAWMARSNKGLWFCLVMGLCLVLNASSTKAQSTTWTADYTIDDCSGSAEQTNTAEDLPCQSYNADLYESLDYTNTEPECSDIDEFEVGSDDDFLYFKWILEGPWNVDCTGHTVVVEVDVDASVESHRGDYYIGMQMKNECDTNPTWEDASNPGFDAFDDDNDDVGGPDPETGDSSCTGCPDPSGGQDGYENDIGSGNTGEVYCRIVGGNFEMAVRRSFLPDLGANPDSDVRVRAWTAQVSSLPKDKLYWHDEQPTSDLPDHDFDNTGWNAGPLALTLTDFSGRLDYRSNKALFTAGMGLVLAGVFARRRRRAAISRM